MKIQGVRASRKKQECYLAAYRIDKKKWKGGLLKGNQIEWWVWSGQGKVHTENEIQARNRIHSSELARCLKYLCTIQKVEFE